MPLIVSDQAELQQTTHICQETYIVYWLNLFTASGVLPWSIHTYCITCSYQTRISTLALLYTTQVIYS